MPDLILDWFKRNTTLLTIVGAAASIVSLLLGIFTALFRDPSEVPTWLWASNFFILSFALITITSVSIYVTYRKIQRLREDDVECLYSISKEVRDGYVELGDKNSVKIPKQVMKDHAREILSNLTELIQNNTGTRCDAYLELFVNIEKDDDAEPTPPPLATYARDSKSVKKRGKNDHENTCNVLRNEDFNLILNMNYDYFYCADIRKRDTYESEAENHRDYPCVAVVPIEKQPKSGNKSTDLWGFLCLDSKVPSAFPEQPTIRLMQGLADELFILLTKFQERLYTDRKQAEVNIDKTQQ